MSGATTAAPSPYAAEIAQIRSAASLDQITHIAARFSAAGTGQDGVLYSGNVATVSGRNIHSNEVALHLADRHGLSIVDATERGRFLADKAVGQAITARAIHLYEGQGLDAAAAKTAAGNFVYGDPHAPPGAATSLQNALWGRASREFVSSLKGDLTVAATNASPDRVLGRVELRTAMDAPQIHTVGRVPTAGLRATAAAAGSDAAALDPAQAAFREAVKTGLYRHPGTGAVALSREAAGPLGLDGARHLPGAELEAGGFLKADPLAAVADLKGVPVTGSVVAKGLGVVGVVAMAYDAATTAHQYAALTRGNNAIGAEAVAGRYVGRTGGGILGGMAAGAAYGALAGVETGPGMLVTGLVGGVVGAVGGERLARAYEHHQADNQTGTDGVGYTYENGAWQHKPWFGAATPAPASQRAGLDYQRETRVVDTAMAGSHDPAANAQIARAYVMDYYGRGWDRAGPLPDTVTAPLHMRPEQALHDPATGKDWSYDGHRYAQTGAVATMFGANEPTGAERTRLDSQRTQAVAENRVQGAGLIDRAYAATQPPRAAVPDPHAYWQSQARPPAPNPDPPQNQAAAAQTRPALRLH